MSSVVGDEEMKYPYIHIPTVWLKGPELQRESILSIKL